MTMIKNNGLVYIEDYEELFVDIQTQRILVDQKSFVDSEPKMAVKRILEDYRKQKHLEGFGLKDFFSAHFELPMEGTRETISSPTVSEHIDKTWELLTKFPGETKGTLMRLPEK